MSLCIASAGKVLALAVTEFTLSWTHSVERIRWHELWEVSAEGLRPIETVVYGSGAGMEIPDGAVLKDGAWHYRPTLPPQRDIFLAASGATVSGWELCAAGQCVTLGSQPGEPIHLFEADRCPASTAPLATN